MDLKNIIDKKSDYADYMLDEITHICKDMDKRDPAQLVKSRLASIWLTY